MIQLRLILLFILFLPTIAGCANSNITAAKDTEEVYQTDRSCSYFYFLWGTHAEQDQRFDEALEAFEKALICDPAASYIEKKIPVLFFRLGETDKAAELLRLAIERDPEDLSQYLLLAHLNIQQNKRDEAIHLYHEVLKRDPANEGVLLRLGILSVQQSRFEEAEQIFRDLIVHNPNLYFARIYLARLLQMRESTDEAADAYEESLRLNWSPELVFEMVDFYSAQGKYEDVLRLYTTIIDNDNTNEKAILGKIQTLLNLGKNEEALTDLRNLRQLNENTSRLDMAIAKIMLRLGKVDEATKVLETLRDSEVASEANYLLGLISFQAKKNDTALDYLHTIPPESDDYADGIYLQVRILRDIGMHGRALELLKNATANSSYHHPLFYALLASLYQEQEKVEEAMASITAGTAAFPTNEQLHFEHALLLERNGLHHKALTAMQRVLELSPDHPEALNFIGYTWADQNINLEQAFQYIQRAAELKPDNGFIRDSLGWVYFRLGNFDNALEELLQALALEPEDPHIYVHIGDVYKALNRTEDARKAYTKGLEMFDNEDDKTTLQKKLDELQTN
jgi:tetratricopeptide (TPR) repeat protein